MDAGASLIPRGGGDTIRDADGRKAVVLAERDQVTITYFRLQPGDSGPPPHLHREHTDAFYVLAGHAGFILGPELKRLTVGAGGLVAAPPNTIHTFSNESEGEIRLLNFHAPDSGFAAYMRSLRDGDGPVDWDSVDVPEGGAGRPLSDAIVSGPGEGERLVSGRRSALLKSDLPDLCLLEFEIKAGFEGPDVHEHAEEVDSFYVLEGQIEVTVEDSRRIAGPGTLASFPPGVRHTFGDGGTDARLLNFHAPESGFADFLRRVSDRSAG
jgi:quercetin dioxygenase-like cupin family protein